MNVPIKSKSFGSNAGILMFPDEYQGFAQTFLTGDPTAVIEENRSIIKAGTVWPSNDANARGIVFYDVDVTEGTATGSVLFEATIKTSKIPAIPSAAAQAALPRITWFPTLVATVITTTTLPDGVLSSAYSQQIAATGVGTLIYDIQSGVLPDGLTLSASGLISGTPTLAGLYVFAITVVSLSNSTQATQTFQIDVA